MPTRARESGNTVAQTAARLRGRRCGVGQQTSAVVSRLYPSPPARGTIRGSHSSRGDHRGSGNGHRYRNTSNGNSSSHLSARGNRGDARTMSVSSTAGRSSLRRVNEQCHPQRDSSRSTPATASNNSSSRSCSSSCGNGCARSSRDPAKTYETEAIHDRATYAAEVLVLSRVVAALLISWREVVKSLVAEPCTSTDARVRFHSPDAHAKSSPSTSASASTASSVATSLVSDSSFHDQWSTRGRHGAPWDRNNSNSAAPLFDEGLFFVVPTDSLSGTVSPSKGRRRSYVGSSPRGCRGINTNHNSSRNDATSNLSGWQGGYYRGLDASVAQQDLYRYGPCAVGMASAGVATSDGAPLGAFAAPTVASAARDAEKRRLREVRAIESVPAAPQCHRVVSPRCSSPKRTSFAADVHAGERIARKTLRKAKEARPKESLKNATGITDAEQQRLYEGGEDKQVRLRQLLKQQEQQQQAELEARDRQVWRALRPSLRWVRSINLFASALNDHGDDGSLLPVAGAIGELIRSAEVATEGMQRLCEKQRREHRQPQDQDSEDDVNVVGLLLHRLQRDRGRSVGQRVERLSRDAAARLHIYRHTGSGTPDGTAAPVGAVAHQKDRERGRRRNHRDAVQHAEARGSSSSSSSSSSSRRKMMRNGGDVNCATSPSLRVSPLSASLSAAPVSAPAPAAKRTATKTPRATAGSSGRGSDGGQWHARRDESHATILAQQAASRAILTLAGREEQDRVAILCAYYEGVMAIADGALPLPVEVSVFGLHDEHSGPHSTASIAADLHGSSREMIGEPCASENSGLLRSESEEVEFTVADDDDADEGSSSNGDKKLVDARDCNSASNSMGSLRTFERAEVKAVDDPRHRHARLPTRNTHRRPCDAHCRVKDDDDDDDAVKRSAAPSGITSPVPESNAQLRKCSPLHHDAAAVYPMWFKGITDPRETGEGTGAAAVLHFPSTRHQLSRTPTPPARRRQSVEADGQQQPISEIRQSLDTANITTSRVASSLTRGGQSATSATPSLTASDSTTATAKNATGLSYAERYQQRRHAAKRQERQCPPQQEDQREHWRRPDVMETDTLPRGKETQNRPSVLSPPPPPPQNRQSLLPASVAPSPEVVPLRLSQRTHADGVPSPADWVNTQATLLAAPSPPSTQSPSAVATPLSSQPPQPWQSSSNNTNGSNPMNDNHTAPVDRRAPARSCRSPSRLEAAVAPPAAMMLAMMPRPSSEHTARVHTQRLSDTDGANDGVWTYDMKEDTNASHMYPCTGLRQDRDSPATFSPSPWSRTPARDGLSIRLSPEGVGCPTARAIHGRRRERLENGRQENEKDEGSVEPARAITPMAETPPTIHKTTPSASPTHRLLSPSPPPARNRSLPPNRAGQSHPRTAEPLVSMGLRQPSQQVPPQQFLLQQQPALDPSVQAAATAAMVPAGGIASREGSSGPRGPLFPSSEAEAVGSGQADDRKSHSGRSAEHSIDLGDVEEVGSFQSDDFRGGSSGPPSPLPQAVPKAPLLATEDASAVHSGLMEPTPPSRLPRRNPHVV